MIFFYLGRENSEVLAKFHENRSVMKKYMKIGLSVSLCNINKLCYLKFRELGNLKFRELGNLKFQELWNWEPRNLKTSELEVPGTSELRNSLSGSPPPPPYSLNVHTATAIIEAV